MHPEEVAVNKVYALQALKEHGNYDEIVFYPDGTIEALVWVDGTPSKVFTTGEGAFFDPTPVLRVHDGKGQKSARPGQLRQLKALRYEGPLPQTENAAARLLDFWQVYYACEVKNKLAPTEGQLQALRNLGYQGPLPRTRDEARQLLAELQAMRLKAA